MSRHQLLCVFVPVEPKQAQSVQTYLDRNKAGFDHLFKRVGSIHFASFALLPGGCRPSLMLELVIDPGLRRGEVLRELVAHGDGLLAGLYALCAGSLAPQAGETDGQALTRFLLAHARRADGGFVGLRDRTVAQVRNEAALFHVARKSVQSALKHPASPTNSSRLAAVVVDRVAGDRSFSRLGTPAPRSFWRSPQLSYAWRLVLVGIVLVLPALIALAVALGVLAIVGILAVAVGATVTHPHVVFETPSVFMGYQAYGLAAVASMLVTLVVLMFIGGLLASRQLSVVASLTAVLALASGFVIALVLMAWSHDGGVAGVLQFLGALGVLLAWGVVVLAGLLLLASVLVFLVWLALLILAFEKEPLYLGLFSLALVLGALLILAGRQAHLALNALLELGKMWSPGPLEALQGWTCWGLPAVDVAALLIVVFVLMAVALLSAAWRVIVRPKNLLRKLDAPQAVPLYSIQQSHPSLEACEAASIGSTNYMISVTDIRRWQAWNRLALRLALRVVTFLGHSVFTEGRLGQADGIKFAQWHVIDEGRRLLFCSNYEGMFGGYLDEFINGASQGINVLWRWTELRKRDPDLDRQPGVNTFRGFPPTRLLFFGGCKSEQWFKAFTRASMLPHLYRYEAYRFTMKSIDQATRLRDALTGERNLMKDDQIMRAVES